MKKFIVFLVFLLTTWCGYGQTFSFSQMSNPDPNLENLGQVLLIGNEALSGTGNFQMYYNGNGWSILPSSPVGAIAGKEISNRIYAVSTGTNLNLWNDSTKIWQMKSAKPAQMTYGVSPFVRGENDVYLVGFDQAENVGWLWHWDGNTFSDLRSDYWYGYCGVYAKDASNIFLISAKNINYDAMFIKINNVTKSRTILYTFPDDRGNPRVIVSRDNNIFFILTDLGDIYRWTNSSSQMDKVFSYATTNIGFSDNMIVIDNDNIVSCGYGGIRHVKVSTGQHTTLYPTSMNFFISGASYNGNGRAMFTGKGGLILDMQVIGSVPDEDVNSALNIYPNPAINSVTLEFPVFGVDKKTVELYSSTGQLVKREHFQSFTTTLDISTLPSGIYLVNVSDDTGKKLASRKLLVR